MAFELRGVVGLTLVPKYLGLAMVNGRRRPAKVAGGARGRPEAASRPEAGISRKMAAGGEKVPWHSHHSSLEGMNGAYSVESKVLQRHKGNGSKLSWLCDIYVSSFGLRPIFFRPSAEKKWPTLAGEKFVAGVRCGPC